MRMLEMDLPSPLPFKKLGVLEPRPLNAASLGGFVLRDDRGRSLANGLEGMRVSPRGGCGNELMLTLFRSVFPVPLTASFGCGSADVEFDAAGVRLMVVARIPDLGVPGVEGMPPVLFRVLFTGKAGRAMLGGPSDGLAGRGNVVVIVCCMV